MSVSPLNRGSPEYALRRAGHTVIFPAALECLAHILRLAAAGEAITFRKLARAMGSPHMFLAVQHVRTLAAAGLIAWERGLSATIRPLYGLSLPEEPKRQTEELSEDA